jgi:hypothetical protein
MTTRADALRILVFGDATDAKASLLAALGQVAEPRPRFEDRPLPASGREWAETRYADAVLLPFSEINADVAGLVQFLTLLEADRGRHAAVAGLPVFIVASRVEMVPRDAFGPFLVRKRGTVAFGQLNVEVVTTSPADVKELVQRCIERGREFRRQRGGATWRLASTVAAAFVILVLLVMAAGALVMLPGGPQASRLQGTIEVYQSREGSTASGRLREPIAPRISELTEITRSPDFAKLPADLQAYIHTRLGELLAYRAYLDRLEQGKAPGQAHNDRELADAEARLQTELLPPTEYQTEWAETPAVLLRGERLDDARALRAAVDQEEAWYRQLQEQGDVLWAFGDRPTWPAWYERVNKLLTRADAPPFHPADRLPGSRRLTVASALRFDRVADARTDWERVRRRLESLATEATALGLIGELANRPALLMIPKGTSIEEARQRFRELVKVYPGYVDWSTVTLPEAVAADIHRAADTAYRNLLPAGQEPVLKRLQQLSPDGKETAARWHEVRDWLATTDELNGWRDLATALARLADAKKGDPVQDLIAFLSRDAFALRIGEFSLQVPDDLDFQPNGAIVVSGSSNGDARAPTTFSLRGEPFVEAKHHRKTYTFVREGGPLALTYFPGDTLNVEVPVNRTGAGLERVLIWPEGPSQVFQFDRLNAMPRIQLTGMRDRPAGPAEGVKLTASPEPVPKVPDLFPMVRLVKR